MDDKESLDLLKEIIENANKRTNSNPIAFAQIVGSINSRIHRISDHITNNSLRTFYLKWLLFYQPFQVAYRRKLRNKLIKYLRDSLKEEEIPDGAKEVVIFAASKVELGVIGDGEGRKLIDINELSNEIEGELGSSGKELINLVFEKVTMGLKEVSEDFSQEGSKELIALYEKIIDACEEGWDSVFEILDKKTLELDEEATFWRSTMKEE